MKVYFFILLFALFLVLPASSVSLKSSSDGGVEIRDGSSLVRFKDRGILIRTPVFSFGSISGGGLLSLLDDPYSSSSLNPSFSTLSQSSREVGTEVVVSKLHLFSFFGERDGGGVLYDGELLDLALVWGGEGEDTDYQKDSLLRTGMKTLWGVGRLEKDRAFSLTVIASASGFKSFSLLVLSSVKYSSIDAAAGFGRTQAFSPEAGAWYRYMRAGISTGGVEIIHELRLGGEPVYLREYRDYEYSVTGKLSLGGVLLKSSITKSFLSGREKREEKMSLTWKELTVGYKNTGGRFFASFTGNRVKIEYEDGKLSVGMSHVFSSDDISVDFNITSEGRISWSVTYSG